MALRTAFTFLMLVALAPRWARAQSEPAPPAAEATQPGDAGATPDPNEQTGDASAAPDPGAETGTTPADSEPTSDDVQASTTFSPSPESETSPASAHAEGSGPDASATLGGQYFWVQDKIMPGVVLRPAVDRYSLDLEATFVYLTKRAPDFDGVFLGNELGLYLSAGFSVVRQLELRGGVGTDIYYLWGINGDEVQAALSGKAAVHVWPWPSFGLFASARSYLVSGGGLELGTTREGEDRFPLLVTTGFELRTEAHP